MVEAVGEKKGMTNTGQVFEQPIRMEYLGQTFDLRRVVVRLKQGTRDGDRSYRHSD